MANYQLRKHRLRLHLDNEAIRSEGPDDELLNIHEVCVWLGVSKPWLLKQRKLGAGPPCTVLSENMIRYRRGDVKTWLEVKASR